MPRWFSEEVESAYYTGTEEVRTLLETADALWGLPPGTKVLEPSVGSGAFPLTAERLGYDLEWVTNELCPDLNNYNADYNEDFLTLPVGKVDLVVGNPPYSGFVRLDGTRLSTAEAFVHRSLEWADRVAFVLPLPILRPRTLARLPKGVRLKGWTEPKQQSYTVAGVGGGAQKVVETVICLFERDGFEGYQFDGTPPDGLEWVPEGDSRATHVVRGWGAVGSTRALDGSWGYVGERSRERWCVVTDPRIEKVLASRVIQDYCGRFSSGSPNAGWDEINWYLRCLLAQWPGA